MSLAGSVFCSAWECVPALKTEGQGLSSYPRRGIVPSGWELFPKQFTVWVVLGKQELATLAGRAPELSPGRAGPLVLLSSSSCSLLLLLLPLVLLFSSSCPPLVLLLSSSCPFLVLLFLSSSCPPLLLVCSCRLNPPSSFCPFLVLLIVLLILWPRWRTLCLPPASSGHVFEPCGSSSPPGVPRCPRATVANPVSFFCCLSRSACPACPRSGPVYHRLTRGLSPAWPRRFSYLHRLVWVCNSDTAIEMRYHHRIFSRHIGYPIVLHM